MKISNIFNQLILVAIVVFLLGSEARLSQAANYEFTNAYLPLVYKNYIKGFTNPGFEIGIEGWIISSNQGDSLLTNSAAHTGQYSAGLGNGGKDRVTSIAQRVKVPQSAYGVQYYQYIDIPDGCPSDFRLMVFVNNEAYKHYICKEGDKGSWLAQDLHLSQLKGTTFDLKLEFQSGSNQDLSLYVDDFSFLLE